MAARKRLPHGCPHSLPVRPNAASMAGIERARAALLSSDPTVVSDLDAIAMREQWRREDEAQRGGQGSLNLGPAA